MQHQRSPPEHLAIRVIAASKGRARQVRAVIVAQAAEAVGGIVPVEALAAAVIAAQAAEAVEAVVASAAAEARAVHVVAPVVDPEAAVIASFHGAAFAAFAWTKWSI